MIARASGQSNPVLSSSVYYRILQVMLPGAHNLVMNAHKKELVTEIRCSRNEGRFLHSRQGIDGENAERVELQRSRILSK